MAVLEPSTQRDGCRRWCAQPHRADYHQGAAARGSEVPGSPPSCWIPEYKRPAAIKSTGGAQVALCDGSSDGAPRSMFVCTARPPQRRSRPRKAQPQPSSELKPPAPTTLESVLPQISSVKRRRRRGIGFGCEAPAGARMFLAPFHFWRAISGPHHGPGSSLSNKGSRIIFARGASSKAFLRSTS